MFSLFAIEKNETVFSFFEKEPPFIVSWSHYLQLVRIENEVERSFYETIKLKKYILCLWSGCNQNKWEKVCFCTINKKFIADTGQIPRINVLN